MTDSTHSRAAAREKVETHRSLRVLFVDDEKPLQELMQADFTAAENYMAFLTGRIQFLNQQIASFTLGDAAAQLMAFLKREAGGAEHLTLDCSISLLARRLNLSRASLYRAFETLEKQGMIQKQGRRILLDPA